MSKASPFLRKALETEKTMPVGKEGKSCPRLLVLQRVAQNAKSCSKLAEHNLFMPNDNLL